MTKVALRASIDTKAINPGESAREAEPLSHILQSAMAEVTMSLVEEAIKRMKAEAQQKKDAAIKAEVELLEKRPIMKLMPDRTDEFIETHYRKEPPAKLPIPKKEAEPDPHVAEQMMHQPAGHQRAPSPAGGNYINPNIRTPSTPGPELRGSLFAQASQQVRNDREARSSQDIGHDQAQPITRDVDREERDDRD